MSKKMWLVLSGALLIFVLGACGNEADMENTAGDYRDSPWHMYNDEISPYSNISSESTTMNSDEFPHTKAVKIQEAKYEFQIDGNQQHDQSRYNINVKRGQPPTGGGQKSERPDAATPGEGQTPTQEQTDAGEEQQSEATPAPAPEQEAAPDNQKQQTDTAGDEINDFEQQVIELTNQQRRNNGLSDLQGDGDLSNVARKKSTDMQENNYFSHTSPTYGSPFDMIRDFGISYNAAAENIAQGQQTPQEVVDAWMNSEGHRQNILNGDFTHIGVGYDANGHHWTQMFITR